MLVHADQFRAGSSLKIQKCSRKNTRKLKKKKNKKKKTEQNIEESGNDLTDLEYEDRPRSLLKRTEEQIRKWHRPSRVARSDRLSKGVKPRRFREV